MSLPYLLAVAKGKTPTKPDDHPGSVGSTRRSGRGHGKRRLTPFPRQSPGRGGDVPDEERDVLREDKDIPHQDNDVPREGKDIPDEDNDVPREDKGILHEDNDLPHRKHERSLN